MASLGTWLGAFQGLPALPYCCCCYYKCGRKWPLNLERWTEKCYVVSVQNLISSNNYDSQFNGQENTLSLLTLKDSTEESVYSVVQRLFCGNRAFPHMYSRLKKHINCLNIEHCQICLIQQAFGPSFLPKKYSHSSTWSSTNLSQRSRQI